MQYKYTDSEIEFMRDNYPHMTARELWVALNLEFNVNHPLESVKTKVKHIGVSKGNASKYDGNQLEYIRKFGAKLSTEELAESLNMKFGVSHTPQSVRTVTKNLGVRKNKDVISKARINKSKYKIGDSVIVNGYEYIKVREGSGNFYKNFERKCRIVWEKANGKLPEGMRVVFLNGDTSDCRIENLMAISNKISARMANGHGRSMWSEHPEITKAAIKVCELSQAVKDKRLE